jgi:caa(3)-type oxidase subunit IV
MAHHPPQGAHGQHGVAAPRDEHGRALDHPPSHEAHAAAHHPTARTYVIVAVILFIITAVEVSAYYIPAWENSRIYVPSMLIMSSAKFIIVVMFYMHLKYDHRLFRSLFTGPVLIAAVMRVLTRPVLCYVLFNVTVAAWHVPALYNAAVRHHEVHIFQHLMFMSTAVLMWWPLLGRVPRFPRLPYPGQMLYCFLMAVPMTIVAVYIAMADSILYPGYAAAPRLWGISPLFDQHLGGLIMWVPGGLFFYGVMTVVFFKWANRQRDDEAGAQVDWRPGMTTG